MTKARVVAILGATGRLGPAVARAFEGWERRGLSRRPAAADETDVRFDRFVVGDRRDRAALAAVFDGADVVVDLLAFEAPDADALLAAIADVAHRPRHLVYASSVAERGFARAGRPPEPDGPYGLGKRAVRLRYEAAFDGVVHTLVLPRLVASVDRGRREQAYLDAALANEPILHAGSGDQRQTIAPVDGVARVVRALADDPLRVPSGCVDVGPPAPSRVADAIRALAEGAGVSGARLARHPDPGWRAPHGGADELLDTRALAEALPDVVWPDTLAVYRELGAWLVQTLPDDRRPRPLVKLGRRQVGPRAVVDVHGRRQPAVLVSPAPHLELLASRISPAIYVDLGRPCNAACIYCAVPPHLDTAGFAQLERLQAHAELGAAAGCEKAILVGGEPTIYPELDRALAMLSRVGLRAGHVVMTNGLRLASAQMLDRLASGGVTTLHVSIDTADRETYARIARTDATFDAQWQGLSAALGDGRFYVYVYACVTRLNAGTLGPLLREIADTARRAGARTPPVLFAFAKPLGDGLVHADRLLLSPPERARVARAVVGDAAAHGVEVGIRNLQACLAPELLPLLVDYHLEDYSIEVETGARVPYAHHAELTAVEACSACAHRAVCPGVYREEAARFGTSAYRTLDSRGLAS